MAPSVNLKLKGTEVEIYGLTKAAHLNGQRGRLNGVLQGDRLGVDLPDGPKALLPANVRILDNGSAQDSRHMVGETHGRIDGPASLIKTRSEIGGLHKCDEFAQALYTACVPKSGARFERMPTNLQDLLNLEGRCTNGVHLMHLAMDAAAHHMVIEFSTANGWRVFQSFVKPGPLSTHSMGSGYTALDWISDAACGSASSHPHQLWGRGKFLERGEISKLFALLHMLRSLVDEVLTEELLKQLPFEKPSGTLADNFQPWVEYMNNVGSWAGEKKDAVSNGISIGRMEDHDVIWMGLQEDYTEDKVLLRISAERSDLLGEVYTRITGEVLRPPVWFSMLIFAFHKQAMSDQGAVGWAYRVAQMS